MDEEYNPFQSPGPVATPCFLFQGDARAPAAQFVSGRVRSIVTRSLLAIVAISDLFAIWGSITQHELLDMLSGASTPIQGSLAADIRITAIIAACNGLANIGAAIAFLTWSHRVYKNLPALGAGTPLSTPGWMVGWYFVPVANLFRPYRLMAEAWRFSDPGQYTKLRKTTSELVAFWWGAFLATVFVDLFITVSTATGPSKSALESLSGMTDSVIVSALVEFVAAISAILLVYWIDKNQHETHRLITMPAQHLSKASSNDGRGIAQDVQSNAPTTFRMTDEFNLFECSGAERACRGRR